MAHTWRWTLIPILVAVALFAHAVPDAGFVADDAFNLAEHARHGDVAGEWTTPTYAHAGGARGHIWRPIPASLQHIVALVFSRDGAVFRTLNLVIHLLNIWLIAWVARRWGAHPLIAMSAALLWSTHPSMPEAVCWSSDIYDLMATSFMLLSLGVIGLRGREHGALLLGVLLMGACLSKESSLALMPVLVILGIHRQGWRYGFHACISVSIGGAAYWTLHRMVTKQGYLDTLTKDVWPSVMDAGLMALGWIVYAPPRAPMAHLFDRANDAPEVWIGIGCLLGLCTLAADQYRRNNKNLLVTLAVLCTIILLIPAAIGMPFIGVAPLRYLYMPMALLAAIALGGIATKPNPMWMVAIGLLTTIGAFRIIQRVPAFENDLRLWEAELVLEPQNPYAAGSWARALIGSGQTKDGIQLWAQAVERAQPGIRVFDVYNERWLLGQTAFLKGEPAIALEQVEWLIERQSNRALPMMTHCLRADSLDALGRHKDASIAGRLCRN